MAVQSRWQFPAKTEPVLVPPPATEDSWHFPWSGPVRTRAIATALIAPALFFVAPIPPPTGGIASTIDVDVRYETRVQYQAYAAPVFTPVAEIITTDKWVYPWFEPVRTKVGLRSDLQQAFIAPVLDPETQITQGYESRWHYPWSEPVRFRQFPVSQQQAEIIGSISPLENVFEDKWHQAWSEPVRQKIGLKTHLQQAFIAPVLNPETQITQNYESRWHQPWSEPVRFRRFPVAEQQFLAFQQSSVEIVTEDKWHQRWSEPVRTKPRLSEALQQFTAFLNPMPAITGTGQGAVPSGVRVGIHYAARTQFQTYAAPVFTPAAETITEDKWHQPWSEPVRQKPGLRTALQQTLIAPVLNPETQIIQGYESRWHQPWSEPVRTRRMRPALQQAFVGVPFITPPTPGTGIGAIPVTVSTTVQYESRTQYQVTALPVFVPPTEAITEDKWHFPWSEPVRVKPSLPVGEQQFLAADTAPIPTTRLEPWFAPLSEPVRLKIGLGATLQQAFIGTVLNPETQIIQGYESRWHQPWSEPVRFRRLATAEVPFIAIPTLSVFEVITEDKWHQGWSEPVRFRIDPRRAIVIANSGPIGPVLNPETQIIQGYESRWHFAWSEPVRQKPGLGAWLQRATTPDTPIFPNLTRLIQWFEKLEEPVRQKPGLLAALQQFFAPSLEPIAPVIPGVTVTLDATETNADRALFIINVYSALPPSVTIPIVVVSIKEIEAIGTASASIEEQPIQDDAAVSIEET